MIEYVLTVALYSALPSLNVAPHDWRRFQSVETCEQVAAHIEAKSTPARTFIAACAPIEKIARVEAPSAFVTGFNAFFGRRP